MPNQFTNSELIINDRGGIYHLDLHPDELAETVIVVGDPERVNWMKEWFDTILYEGCHREFNWFTGRIGTNEFTVISSGIGPDNIDILINELDAVANIDFKNKQIKKHLKSLNILRLGTCGSININLNPGDMIATKYSIGHDGLMNYYHTQTELNNFHNYLKEFAIAENLPMVPYAVEASSNWQHKLAHYYQGLTLAAPGFYGPQGRKLRLPYKPKNGIACWEKFCFNQRKIDNIEMETASLFALGKLLGHQVGALCVVLANRVNGEFHKQPKKAIYRLLNEAFAVLTN